MEALFLRQLRKCTQLQDKLRDYDRLLPGDERRCYAELMASARRHLKRVRLQKHRDAMTSAIAGGNALALCARIRTGAGRTEVTRGKTRAEEKAKENKRAPMLLRPKQKTR